MEPSSRENQPYRIVFQPKGWNPRPAFLVGPGWEPRIFAVQMDRHWCGIDILGERRDILGNSFLLLPAHSWSARAGAHFDPESPYFQAFFGVYVLPANRGRRLPPQVIDQLGSRDQMAWLRSMGDPAPKATIEQPATIDVVERDAGGQPRKWSFVVRYLVHGDLGHPAPGTVDPGARPVAFDRGDRRWERTVRSYQEMTMTSRGFLWYEGEHLIVNFFNGIAFQSIDGWRLDTYEDRPAFREEMLRMAAGLRIADDGTGFAPSRGSLAQERRHT